MIRQFLAVAACLWLAACSGSSADDREWPAASPALWELTDAKGEQGWLFGTVHALPESVKWQSAAVSTALDKSDLLVVEIANLGDSHTAASIFQKRSTTLDLPPLTQRVPAKDRELIRELLVRASMDEADFTDVETWGAALMLAEATRKFSTEHGVDRALLRGADNVAGLEAYEIQFSLFDGLADDDQAYLLVAIAEEVSKSDQADHIAAWLTGDVAVLEHSAMEGMLANAELRETLLTARNRAWSARIALLLKEGERPFVAVGAAHMFGESGLPALLAARGYRVERIQ